MPNPLTDELTAEAKAELAAIFAAMKATDRRRRREAALQIRPLQRRGFW